MKKEDIDIAVNLIRNSMNDNEGNWARATMDFHFNCSAQGIDDGRDYYLWWDKNQLHGIVGLHRYIWGPPENVWLAWFAVSYERQGMGYGRILLESIEEKAKTAGYHKLFVETYKHPVFEKATRFYKKAGFRVMGSIEDYLPDGSEMIVLGKNLIS